MNHTRRLALVALGALLAVGCTTPVATAPSHSTDALLLSCMDYRLTDDTTRYFEGRGMRDRYDHVALAGASLAVLAEPYPAWGSTFWEHLAVAIELHHVHKVVVLDHRDCGAYRALLGEDFAKSPARETAIHAEKLRALRDAIREKHPDLEVEMLLMALDGSVETIR